MQKLKKSTKRGFFTIVQNTEETDYLRHAYAQALSIKLSQPIYNNYAIGVDEYTKSLITDKHLKVFDDVIDIPWGDDAEFSEWKLENEWKCVHMLPYEKAFKLDCDMLFMRDITEWWDILDEYEFVITTKPKNLRGETIKPSYYQRYERASGSPEVYSALLYFGKNTQSHIIFKGVEHININWPVFYKEFSGNHGRPSGFSTDSALGMSIRLFGDDDNYRDRITIPSFIHMKSGVQDWNTAGITEDWTKHVTTYFTPDCELIVGNYKIKDIFHYHIKSWLTDDMIYKMEKKLGL